MSTIDVQSPASERQEVKALLAAMRKTMTGGIILDGIEDSERDIRIKAYDRGKAGIFGQCNAVARPTNAAAAAPAGVGRGRGRENFYIGKPDDPKTFKDERFETQDPKVVGKGSGSDVDVYFSPNVMSGCNNGQYASKTDEVLLHELVHALRSMSGQTNPIPTDNPRYRNEEEFLAIVTTNVYISEKGGTRFRADHYGHTRLMPPLDTSKGFLTDKNNLDLMKIHWGLWQPFYYRLGFYVLAAFNPFRQLMLDERYLVSKQ